jgi:hypothetical protein
MRFDGSRQSADCSQLANELGLGLTEARLLRSSALTAENPGTPDSQGLWAPVIADLPAPQHLRDTP